MILMGLRQLFLFVCTLEVSLSPAKWRISPCLRSLFRHQTSLIISTLKLPKVRTRKSSEKVKKWRYRELGSGRVLSPDGGKNCSTTAGHLFMHLGERCQVIPLCLTINSPLMHLALQDRTHIHLRHSMPSWYFSGTQWLAVHVWTLPTQPLLTLF